MDEEPTPKKDKQGDRQEPTKQHNTPTEPPPFAVVVTNTVRTDPIANPEQGQTEREYRERQERLLREQIDVARRLNWVTAAAAVVGFIGLLILGGTLWVTKIAADAARMQAQSALDTLHSRRPNITFGLDSGVVADYLPPEPSQAKGKILIFFRNTGQEPSPHTLINAYSNLSPSDKGEMRHLLRYRPLITGKPAGIAGVGGVSIAGQSRYDCALDEKWVPDPKQWANIAADIRGKYGPFRVEGTFEYCDSWGVWRCEAFQAEYNPALSKFVSGSSLGIGCEYTTPDPGELARGPGNGAELLPPCEQPNEGTQKGGANYPYRIGRPLHMTVSSGEFGASIPESSATQKRKR